MLTAAVCPLAVSDASAAATGVPYTASAASGSTWSTAEQVPGLTGGSAQIVSISCASPGNCSAGGGSYNNSGVASGFVVNQTGGVWGTAQFVGISIVSIVSCTSPGHCSAAGFDENSDGDTQAFLLSETAGTWGAPTPVPGLAGLNTGSTNIGGLSCASPGNCTAGGSYTQAPRQFQAFVVSEVNGTWGTAKEVPGVAALNQGGQATSGPVSCISPGNCTVAGSYTNNSGYKQPFIIRQTGGSWGTAEKLPPMPTLDANTAEIDSVSCRSAGSCSAGGFEANLAQAFVVREVRGRWLTPQTVWGLHQYGYAAINSVSCGSPGNCVAGGSYQAKGSIWDGFLVNEVNGVWRAGEPVSGLALGQGGTAGVYSVSCASPGNCSAGGNYWDASDAGQAFVVNETNGTWGSAQQVPGTATLNTGGFAQIRSVSCTSPGNCSAGGLYSETRNHYQAFVVSETSTRRCGPAR